MAFQTGFVFVAASLPFLCWQIPISISREVAHPVPASRMDAIVFTVLPAKFSFRKQLIKRQFLAISICGGTAVRLIFFDGACMCSNLVFNPLFRRDKKVHAIIGLSWVLIGVVYYFDYIHPSRFVVGLEY